MSHKEMTVGHSSCIISNSGQGKECVGYADSDTLPLSNLVSPCFTSSRKFLCDQGV